MQRGLSTIEILIALTITTSAIVACVSLILTMPSMLHDARLTRGAYAEAGSLLAEAELRAGTDIHSLMPIATTTSDGYTVSRSIEPIYDELASRVTASASWSDLRGTLRGIELETLVSDPVLGRDLSCSPFMRTDWTRPVIAASYRLSPGMLLPQDYPSGPYPLSRIALLDNRLIVASDIATRATHPTLFFFTVDDSAMPVFAAAYDNATSSREGVKGIDVGNGHAYIANGFGSVSTTTCATNSACAQLHIFDLSDAAPSRVSALELPMHAPPYARTVDGATAAAHSIAYRRGYTFLGLEKTANGYEFNIIDVRNPRRPRWISGLPIGRSVEHIAVTATHAYLATSDSDAEIVVIDIRDPAMPIRVGSWDAPGIRNFGLGSQVQVRGSKAYFGRTYVPNAAEFFLLDVQDPTNTQAVGSIDTGMPANPQGIRGIVVRGPLATVLSGNTLHFWQAEIPDPMLAYAPDLTIPSEGTSLACAGEMLFVGSTEDGAGTITLVTGS